MSTISSKSFVKYELQSSLHGHSEPVNVLLFIQNGRLLVSGGDDRHLCIWDVESHKCVQSMTLPEWGQILAVDALEDRSTARCILFVSTAKGNITIIPGVNGRFDISASTIQDEFETPIEVQALDSVNARLFCATHSNRVAMFSFRNSRLTKEWEIDIADTASSIIVLNSRQGNVLVHTLYDSMIYTLDPVNGCIHNHSSLARPGLTTTVSISCDESMLCAYQASTHSFHLYAMQAPRFSSYPLPVDPKSYGFMKKSCFAEDDCVVVCGGGDGCVRIFPVGERVSAQELRHEEPTEVYCVAAAKSVKYLMIASADTSKPSTIYLWSKQTPEARERQIIEDAEKRVLEEQSVLSRKLAEEQSERTRKAEVEAQRARHQADFWKLVLALMLTGWLVYWASGLKWKR